jgi:hypothetical protein
MREPPHGEKTSHPRLPGALRAIRSQSAALGPGGSFSPCLASTRPRGDARRLAKARISIRGALECAPVEVPSADNDQAYARCRLQLEIEGRAGES